MEAALPAIMLEPHPDPQLHPLAYQRALRRAQRQAAAAAAGEEGAEESEEDEGGLGLGPMLVGGLHAQVNGWH